MGDLRLWPRNDGSVNFHTIPFDELYSSMQALKVRQDSDNNHRSRPRCLRQQLAEPRLRGFGCRAAVPGD
jgi:hypothetical protein